MRQTCKTMARRLKAQQGFSLMEMLAVIVVMTLVGIMMATGIPAAQRAYLGAVDAANAESVLFTTVEQLRSKLSTAGKTVNANPESEKTGRVIVSYEDVSSDVNTSIVQVKNEGIYIDRWSSIDDESVVPEREKLIPAPLEAGAKDQLIVQFKSGGLAGIFPKEAGLFTIKGLEVIREGETEPLAELDTEVTVRSIVTD